MEVELSSAYVLTFGALTTVGLLLLLLAGQRVLTPQHTLTADLRQENAGRALLHVGQVLGVFFVGGSVVRNCVTGESVQRDALWVAVFGTLGLALLVASGRLGVALLLRSRLPTEIARGNAAAGLAAGAHFVATGIITSKVAAGNALRDVGLTVTFFVIAQLTLHAVVLGFRALTSYDDAEQIQSENLAAALSYAGLTIAVAIVVGHAVEGDFEGWAVSLRAYGKALLFVLALYPVRQLVVQSLLLGGRFSLWKGSLDDAVGAHRHEGAAALEAASYIATAILVTRLA